MGTLAYSFVLLSFPRVVKEIPEASKGHMYRMCWSLLVCGNIIVYIYLSIYIIRIKFVNVMFCFQWWAADHFPTIRLDIVGKENVGTALHLQYPRCLRYLSFRAFSSLIWPECLDNVS